MTYLVTVTFDLRGADTSVYLLIHRDLAKIDFSKVIIGKKEVEKRLPHNTFVAKFELDEFDRGGEVTEYVKGELRKIFKKRDVRGRYFVDVGCKWAMRVGTIS